MTHTPKIFQISTSRGGVPKTGIPRAEVGELGIVGDVQRDRRYHGGPERALCLFPLERMLQLQEEGHPIFPGATGENITTIGIDPEVLVPGARLKLGNDVEIEILSYTVPCRNINDAFADGNSARISQKLFPGWSRVYARVIHGGPIAIGDPITILETSSRNGE